MSMEELFRIHADEDRRNNEAIRAELKEVNEKLDKLTGNFSRWQGFVAGVMFIVSLFWIVVGFFKEKLLEWLT